jgi:hypothetical protein
MKNNDPYHDLLGSWMTDFTMASPNAGFEKFIQLENIGSIF